MRNSRRDFFVVVELRLPRGCFWSIRSECWYPSIGLKSLPILEVPSIGLYFTFITIEITLTGTLYVLLLCI